MDDGGYDGRLEWEQDTEYMEWAIVKRETIAINTCTQPKVDCRRELYVFVGSCLDAAEE